MNEILGETMFEVTWVHKDGASHATVTPITIIREGIAPGCSAPRITAIDPHGRKFHGSRESYFETKEAAWDSVIKDLTTTVSNYRERASSLQLKAREVEAYLNTLLEMKKW